MASNEINDCTSDENDHESLNSDPESSGLDEYSSSDSENEDTELTDTLKAMADKEEIKAVLMQEEMPSITSLVEDFKNIAIILKPQNEATPSYCPPPHLPASSSSPSDQIDILNALSSISSRLEQFTSHLPPNLPDHTSFDSACNVARQISYWSSIFVSMCQNSSPSSALTPPSLMNTTSDPVIPTASLGTPLCPAAPVTILQPSMSSSSHTAAPPVTILQPSMSSSSHTPAPPGPSSSTISCDSATYSIYLAYHRNNQSLKEWLESIRIPRNIKSLKEVQKVWEEGMDHCPPLRDWTATMRCFKGPNGSHTSVFNERKKIYELFKNVNFEEDVLKQMYGLEEVTPGKLYKSVYCKK